MSMRSRGRVAIAIWALLMAICAVMIARAHYTADLSAFLPNTPSPEQQLMVSLLRDGPASHLAPEWLRVSDAVVVFGIGRSKLYALMAAGQIRSASLRARGNLRGRRLISADSVRLFNVQGVNDRLLAMYYAEHHEYLADALAAAKSDLTKRGDEIYADDTMAWVLAAMGRWQQARVYAVRATRLVPYVSRLFTSTLPEASLHNPHATHWRLVSASSASESSVNELTPPVSNLAVR